MNLRTRYRLSAVPFVVVSICLAALVAVLWVPKVAPTLREQVTFLPILVLAVAACLPIIFAIWYAFTFVEVRRGALAMRSFHRVHAVDLRQLVGAEVHGRGDDAGAAAAIEDAAAAAAATRAPLSLASESDVRRPKPAKAKAKTAGGRNQFELVLRLEDAEGRVLFLPLNTWRDEDLLMARVLRATVERRVRIEGEPALVRRFSGLLDTYKSWDRQRVAA